LWQRPRPTDITFELFIESENGTGESDYALLRCGVNNAWKSFNSNHSSFEFHHYSEDEKCNEKLSLNSRFADLKEVSCDGGLSLFEEYLKHSTTFEKLQPVPLSVTPAGETVGTTPIPSNGAKKEATQLVPPPTASNQIMNLSTPDQLMEFYRNCSGEEFADPALTPKIHEAVKKTLGIATLFFGKDLESIIPFTLHGGCGAKSSNNVTVEVAKNKLVLTSPIDDPISLNLHLSPSQIEYEVRRRDASDLHRRFVSILLSEDDLADGSMRSYVCFNPKDYDDCTPAGMGGFKAALENVAKHFEGQIKIAKDELLKSTNNASQNSQGTSQNSQGNGSSYLLLGGVGVVSGIGLGLYTRHKSRQKKEAKKVNTSSNPKNMKKDISGITVSPMTPAKGRPFTPTRE